MADIAFRGTIPILRSFSEAKAREFYLGFLGFAIDWEHRFSPGAPLYLQISRAGLVLHISEHHGDACPGSCVFVPIEGIEALQAELIGRDYPNMRPGIEAVPWGREMIVTDPFGNRLRFCEQRHGSDA